MPNAIALRPDFDASALRGLAEIATTVRLRRQAVLLIDQAQRQPAPAAGEAPRIERQGERLAVNARQPAVQSRLRHLRRHRRPLLQGLEQTHRPGVAHHLNRNTRLGASVLSRGSW